MENIVESYIDEFKDLKRKKEGVTIDEFVAKHPDVAEELAPRLYFDMFEAWSKITTTRKAIDWIRKEFAERRGGNVDIKSIYDTTEDGNPYIEILRSPSDDPAASLLAKEILEAFEGFPEPQPKICFLYYVDGYNDREIGKMLKMKPNTVTIIRTRIVKKVREKLQKGGYHE